MVQDERIESYENQDIRDFKYPQKFDVIVSDVSFISLLKIIKKIDSFAKKDIILLFKPQFEVGKEVKRDKRGVIKDEEAIKKARENFETECENLGWKLIRSEESSIKGKEGNTEYIYHFVKNKKVKNLSKGFKQRLKLYFALASRKKIVVLDEPFDGLDPIIIKKITKILVLSVNRKTWFL